MLLPLVLWLLFLSQKNRKSMILMSHPRRMWTTLYDQVTVVDGLIEYPRWIFIPEFSFLLLAFIPSSRIGHDLYLTLLFGAQLPIM